MLKTNIQKLLRAGQKLRIALFAKVGQVQQEMLDKIVTRYTLKLKLSEMIAFLSPLFYNGFLRWGW
jgi:hypothetical protein